MFPVEYRASIEIPPSEVPSTTIAPFTAEVLSPIGPRIVDSPNSTTVKTHDFVIPRVGDLGNFAIIGRNHSIRILAG